jgi:predicted O-methyltransferase YrrM
MNVNVPMQDPLNELDASVWTFAALIATLREAQEGSVSAALAAAPQRTAVLEAAGLVGRGPDGLSLVHEYPQSPGPVSAKLSSFRQAIAAAAGEQSAALGWAAQEDAVLLNQGRASAATGKALATRLVPELAGLAGRLDAEGARILDIGTGIGAIATELARAFPQAHVVGIDILERVLKLAEQNRAENGADVADRVELRRLDVAELAERDAYDLVWIPVPFLSDGIVESALRNAAAAVRSGGWLVAGTNPPATSPLLRAIADWNALRNDGSSADADAVSDLISTQGLTDLRRFPTVPGGPILVAARRA